jgi:hypothetical protein
MAILSRKTILLLEAMTLEMPVIVRVTLIVMKTVMELTRLPLR